MTTKDRQATIDHIIQSAAGEFQDGEAVDAQKLLRSLLLSETNGGKLYKYRTVNPYSLENLRTQTLFCSKPSAFNDPYDCWIGIDLQSLAEAQYSSEIERIETLFDKFLSVYRGEARLEDFTPQEQTIFRALQSSPAIKQCLEDSRAGLIDTEEAKRQYIRSHFNVIIDLIEPLLRDSALRTSFPALEKFYPTMVERMQPDGGIKLADESFDISAFASMAGVQADQDEIALSVALCKQLGLTSDEAADRADESLKQLSKRLAKALDDRFFVGCLSADFKNRLMWSHYADSHRGFCIEYDFSQAPDDLLPLPVVYSRMRPKFPWQAVLNQSEQTAKEANCAFLLALLTKDDAWAYEHEWRMVISSTMDQRLKMPPISCIYLGVQCPEEDRATLIEIASQMRIPVKQMVTDRGEYTLHAKDIPLSAFQQI